MTATETETTVTELVAIDSARFRFTIQASTLASALRNVAPFASTDDTLPILTGVQVTVSGREVTLLTTDRYTLARQVLTLDADDVTGCGSIVLPKATIKALSAATKARNWELTSITAGDDDTITVICHDGATSTTKALSGDFPRCGKMLDDFQPAPDVREVSSLPSIAFNAGILARFAKVGRAGKETVTLVVAADSVHDYSGSVKRNAKPVRWECGDASGLICAIRLAA